MKPPDAKPPDAKTDNVMITFKHEKTRKTLKYLLPFVLAPALLAAGVFVFEEKQYALIMLVMAMLSFVLFAAGIERRKTGTRRLVLTGILSALAIVGRFIPVFKPVAAITILCGMYLGPEAGFLCGSVTALVSNFYFGQGPWTPFQMLAWGLIGFFAGLISKGLLRSRILLYVFGALSGIAFSLIMDVWTVLWYNGVFNIDMYLAALATAVPYTVAYAVSNVLFLVLLAGPFGEKLSRIKTKYGI